MKTLIAVPCLDEMATVFVRSLVNLQPVGSVRHAFEAGSLVYAARNRLCEMAKAENTDFVLWLDSDMVFPSSLLVDLMTDIKGRDMVTGICHMRRPPFNPTLYKKLRLGVTADDNESEDYLDYPKNEIFEIDGCGMACCLMRTEVIEAVMNKYHDCFAPLPGYGEDLSFCIRARACGYSIHADPRLQIGHRAETIITNNTFEAYRRQEMMTNA